MPVPARIPRDFRLLPFCGSVAVASGMLTAAQLRGPTWRRLFPDIYICADVPLDHRLLSHAALLYARATPSAALSGLSAAHAFGVDLLPLGGAPVELTVPASTRLRATGAHLRIVRSALAKTDLAQCATLRVTSPERTLFDLARRLPRPQALAAVDALLFRGVVRNSEEIAAYLDARRRFPGAVQAAEVLALAEPLSESPMESICRLTLIDGGLPRPVAQHRVVVNGLFVARLDFAYPHRHVGLEYEGDHHRERSTFRSDIARINLLQDLGWTIIRVTADDVLRKADQMVARVRRLL